MPTFLSQEKLEELKQELETRKKVTRREIAERISAAKELGDLSENFEYHEAKDEQGLNEVRIANLEQMISEAVVVEEKTGAECISLGVSFKAKVGDMEKAFTIVGSNEADPMAGKISNESPLGQALLGHCTGDKIDVEVPSGTITYEILKLN